MNASSEKLIQIERISAWWDLNHDEILSFPDVSVSKIFSAYDDLSDVIKEKNECQWN